MPKGDSKELRRGHTSPASTTQANTFGTYPQEGPASRTQARQSNNKSLQEKAEPIARCILSHQRTLQAASNIASAVEMKGGGRTPKQHRIMHNMKRRLKNTENKKEQSMAVLDQDTGKMLNYRQLP